MAVTRAGATARGDRTRRTDRLIRLTWLTSVSGRPVISVADFLTVIPVDAPVAPTPSRAAAVDGPADAAPRAVPIVRVASTPTGSRLPRAVEAAEALALQREGHTLDAMAEALGKSAFTVKDLLSDARFYEAPEAQPERLAVARRAAELRTTSGMSRRRSSPCSTWAERQPTASSGTLTSSGAKGRRRVTEMFPPGVVRAPLSLQGWLLGRAAEPPTRRRSSGVARRGSSAGMGALTCGACGHCWKDVDHAQTSSRGVP